MVEKIQRAFLIVESYNRHNILREERLTKYDIIKKGDDYSDTVETRRSIHSHLKNLATKIRNLPFVKSCTPDISPDKIKRGLSNYIEIVFEYPDGLTKEEVDKHYHYTIRFSDHEDKHKDTRVHKTSYVDLVGRKVDNLQKSGIKLFWQALPQIQESIEDFEIEKFGEVKTNILQTSNTTQIRENLTQIDSGLYCTDYAGDIANWLLNKPKPYRIIYDSYFDVWCIADANNWTHDKMAKEMFSSGYIEEVANKDKLEKFLSDANEHFSKYVPGVKFSNRELYKSYGFAQLYLEGCMFIPNSDNYDNYEESKFYSYEIRLTTGILFVYDMFMFSPQGHYRDLYNALERRNAILDTLDSLWKECLKLHKGDAVDYFYQQAEEVGYDEEEIQDFLDKHLLDNIGAMM